MKPPTNRRRRILRIGVALVLLTCVSVGLVHAILGSREAPNIQVRFENIEPNNFGFGGEFVVQNLGKKIVVLGSLQATVSSRSGSISNLNVYRLPGVNGQMVPTIDPGGSNVFVVNGLQNPSQWTAEVKYFENSWVSEKTEELVVWSDGRIARWIPWRLLTWVRGMKPHHFSIEPQEIPPPHP